MTSQVSDEPAARVEFASRSDVGQVRSANEDSCDSFERTDGTRLLVVADGMGGHQGGATASRTTVATIAEIFDRDSSSDTPQMIATAIREANARVYAMAQVDRELEGMGTTVVAFLLDTQSRATVAHVGDSRAYRYRMGRLDPLTTDHSVVAEMLRRGLISADEAAIHPRRNEILRSVGVLPEVDVEVATIDVAPGDRFVLCSDGLSGVVEDEEIAAVVQSQSPSSAVDTLIEMANERGGPDNITVQVLAVPADATAGDPEATAPVELSEVGIQAIENKRRARIHARRLVLALLLVALGLAGYFILRSLRSEPSTEQAIPRPAATTESVEPDRASRTGAEPEGARRGVPR
jgi:serine/threonine protein phosphatase PrpC